MDAPAPMRPRGFDFDRASREPMLLVAFSTFVVSVLIFIALVTGACQSNSPAPGAAAPTVPEPTPGEPTPTTPAPAATPTLAATAVPPSPTSVPSPAAGEAIVVACGDPLAPLDKQHRLPADCAPSVVQLDKAIAQGTQYMKPDAATAFADLVSGARADGFTLAAVSAYRSYQDQVITFDANVRSGGLEYASRTSARAGHSEHQLGTTVDVSSPSANFGLESFVGTPEAQWLAENAARYGFVVSYPDGKEPITGYAYEPWHIRFVGKAIAADLKTSGLTLHEYLLKR
ncbi:MAG: D-alanyl-D-alanine carboxypeptidase family protein [Dehalococcoidia bacterium]